MRIGNITGSGQALFSTDGTLQVATKPTISFNGDENTGIYQISADTIGFATQGAERIRITSTGVLTAAGNGAADGGYAALVTALGDGAIPNRLYVTDKIATEIGLIALEDLTNVTGSPSAVDEFVVSTGVGQWGVETAANARISLGLVAGGTGDIWVEKAGDTMDSGANLTFTGDGEVLGLPATPSGPTYATSKAYVDNLVSSSVSWRDPIECPALVDTTATEPGSPGQFTTYIKFGGTQAEAWTGVASVSDFDILEFDGTNWGILGVVAAGTRFGLTWENSPDGSVGATSNLYGAGLRAKDLIEYVSGDPTTVAAWSLTAIGDLQAIYFGDANQIAGGDSTGLVGGTTYDFNVDVDGTPNGISILGSSAATFTNLITEINADLSGATASLFDGHIHITNDTGGTILIEFGTVDLLTALNFFAEIRGAAIDGTTVLANNEGCAEFGHVYLYAHQNHNWTEIAGPGSIGAGDGLSYSGNILNVNFGAGTIQTPDDEVGIDLRVLATGALAITPDGVVRRTTIGSMLSGDTLDLFLDGTTLTQASAAGLKVASGGITETELNTSVAGDGISGGGGTALAVDLATSSGLEFSSAQLRMAIGSLAVGGTVAGADFIAVEPTAGTPDGKVTLTTLFNDLDVPNNITTVGLIVRTGSDTYDSRTITAAAAGSRDGLNVTDGNGAGANPLIGLDIVGNVAAAEDAVALDRFIGYNVSDSANETFTLQEMANGISGLLSVDNSRIVDAATTTYIDVTAAGADGADTGIIISAVKAGTTHAAVVPFTMSADAGLDFLSADATGVDSAGAPITVTSGDGDGNGAGGLIDIEAGVAGDTGPGGAVVITAGIGGATSGPGGAVVITAGAGTVGAGGIVTLKGGASGTTGDAGAANVIGGAGTASGRAGGDVTLLGGAGNVAGAGGSVSITTGDGGTTGNAGNIDLTAANGGSTSGDAGSINLITNAAETSGTDGFVALKGGAAGHVPSLRFQEDSTNGTEYIGMKAPSAITTSITYTLPIAPTISGYVLSSLTNGTMSWVDAASAGANAFGTITTNGGVDAVALTNGDSVAIVGGTNSGIVTTGAATPSVTITLDINDLSGGTTLVLADSFGVYDLSATATLKYTLADVVEDLDIPNNITANGFVVRTSDDNYASRTIAVESTGSLEGLAITDGIGASGNPTLGLNITGMTTAAVDMDATDKFVVFDGSNNVSMVGQDIADGVKTILSLDNTRIRDAGDDTFIDTDAVTNTITSGVDAGGNFAAGTPLTLSAASSLITSSDAASAANPGAPLSLTAGLGLTTGTGGAVNVTAGETGTGIGGAVVVASGAGGTTGAGGDISLTSGAGGSTSGNAGAIDITGGAGDAGGVITVTGGAGDAGAGGSTIISGGASTSGTGGLAAIVGGDSATGAAGAANIRGGDTSAGTAAGGDVTIQAGVSFGGTDGTIKLLGVDSGTAAELRFYESNSDADNYIGMSVPALSANVDYTLPIAPGTNGFVLSSTIAGVMTWVDPVSAGSFAFGTIVTDAGVDAVADTGADTLSLVGATNGGIITTGATTPDSVTFAMDINDLAVGSANTLALTDTFAVYDGATQKYTFTDMVEDLEIPFGVGSTVGFVTLDGTDSYATHTLAAASATNLEGISVSAGGTSGAADVTIGLDINGTTAAPSDLLAADKIMVYDAAGADNVAMTGQQLADGLNTLLSIDTTKISDGGSGVAETFIDTAASTDVISSQVAAGSNNALGTPLTMSADGGTLLTSSAGLSGNPGGVISLTTGAGEGVGAGGALSATGGVGGANGAGGALTLTGGAGGATAGAGGDIDITGGANGGSGAGGDITVTGGAANLTKGGDVTLAGGDGTGVDGGDVIIAPGDSNTAGGGSIVLQPGTGATDGTISVSAGSSATEMRFYDVAADNYVGFRAADVLSVDTSYIWPTADGSASDVLITDGSGNLSFAAPGAGLTAGEGIDITGSTISLDIGGLTADTIVLADELAFWDQTATAQNNKTTVANFVTDLDIVTAVFASGIITKTANDTYIGRSIAVSAVAGDQGLSIVNGNGVAGNPTVGLDIIGLASGGNAAATDQLVGYNGTNNVEFTVAELAAGMDVGDLADVGALNNVAGEVMVDAGSGTGLVAEKIQHIETFTGQTSVTVTHDIGQQFCIVQVFDGSNVQIIPASVTLTSSTVCTVGFAVATTGTIVVMGIPGVTA